MWLLSVVTKQDLWWRQRAAVEARYGGAEYSGLVDQVIAERGAKSFRHEVVFASLVISNFVTGRGEPLAPNAAGYDHRQQMASLLRLTKTLNDLHEWESGK
jgi:hypothetical protein